MAVYGCVLLYMAIYNCIAAAAAAAQHDYTLSFRNACAFRPQRAQDDGERVGGFSLAQRRANLATPYVC